MKVQIELNHSCHKKGCEGKPGDVIEVSAEDAQYLLERGGGKIVGHVDDKPAAISSTIGDHEVNWSNPMYQDMPVERAILGFVRQFSGHPQPIQRDLTDSEWTAFRALTTHGAVEGILRFRYTDTGGSERIDYFNVQGDYVRASSNVLARREEPSELRLVEAKLTTTGEQWQVWLQQESARDPTREAGVTLIRDVRAFVLKLVFDSDRVPGRVTTVFPPSDEPNGPAQPLIDSAPAETDRHKSLTREQIFSRGRAPIGQRVSDLDDADPAIQAEVAELVEKIVNPSVSPPPSIEGLIIHPIPILEEIAGAARRCDDSTTQRESEARRDDSSVEVKSKRRWTCKEIRAVAEAHVTRNGYPGRNALAVIIKCPPASLTKAIQKSPLLSDAKDARDAGSKPKPGMIRLSDKMLAERPSAAQCPAELIIEDDEDDDALLRRLIEAATPARRASINAMSESEQRELVAAFKSQQKDDRSS